MTAPALDFPDPDDPDLFPRLCADHFEQLAAAPGAQRRTYEEGGVLFEQAEREAPFFIVEDGAVDFYDRRPDGDHYFAQCRAGTFVGDLAMFTGEPTIAACVAACTTQVLALPRETLRGLVAGAPELGDLILRTLIARREWLEGHGYGQVRLLGSRYSRAAFEVRELLERNLVPFRWYDVDSDAESRALLDMLGVADTELPVLVRPAGVLRHPTPRRVADDLGLRARVDGKRFDLLVLGAGPAGLAAAVYGASEGLSTLVLEAKAPGGQAATSARIENYLGFPTGITGAELAQRATLQARKFGAVLSSAHTGCRLMAEFDDGWLHLDMDDDQQVQARVVVVATGADYRRPAATGVDRFSGAGLYYSVAYTDATQCAGDDVLVIGGGNSAGQAVVNLAGHARTVHVVIRRDALGATMSRYLVDRIEQAGNVEVHVGTEVAALHGTDGLEAVTLAAVGGGSRRRLAVKAAYAMIGTTPRTDGVRGLVGLDGKGFIVTGERAAQHPDFARDWTDAGRSPLLLETTRARVIAAGDVRAGATNRVAAAVGDGALAVRLAHELLERGDPRER